MCAGCDDLVSAVFDLGKGLCRLQLSDDEMALFSAAVLLTPGDYLSCTSPCRSYTLIKANKLEKSYKFDCKIIVIIRKQVTLTFMY